MSGLEGYRCRCVRWTDRDGCCLGRGHTAPPIPLQGLLDQLLEEERKEVEDGALLIALDNRITRLEAALKRLGEAYRKHLAAHGGLTELRPDERLQVYGGQP